MEQKAKATNSIVEGVIWKSLLAFFFPILLGTFFQQMYNTVDTIIVGRFVSTRALTAAVFAKGTGCASGSRRKRYEAAGYTVPGPSSRGLRRAEGRTGCL